jgi:hypothetical protein
LAPLPADFARLTPAGEIFTTVLDVPDRSWDEGFPGISSRFEWFAIEYQTTFEARESDTYTFELASDDGSKLFVNGHLVIDNDGIHGYYAARGKVPLARGRHKMIVQYFQGPRYRVGLRLSYLRKGTEWQVFPGTDFALKTPGLNLFRPERGDESFATRIVRLRDGRFVPFKGALKYGDAFAIEGRLREPATRSTYRVEISRGTEPPFEVVLYPRQENPRLLRSELLYLIWDVTRANPAVITTERPGT